MGWFQRKVTNMGLTTLALAASLANVQGVTLEAPAQSLAQLMPKLSQATGRSLVAGPLMSSDVVMVSLKDATVDDVLTKLAKTVGGVWTKSGDTLRLDRDMQLEAKEIQSATAERAEYLKGEIAKLVESMNKQPVFDPAKLRADAEALTGQFRQAEQAVQTGQAQPTAPQIARGVQGAMNMQASMPGGRAIIQTLAGMRVEDLAKIGVGQRVVFTSLPTPMQKPLPSSAVTIMRTFIADQQKLGAMMGQGRNRQQGRQQGTAGQNASAPQAQQAPAPVPSKSFLIVTRNGFSSGLNLNYVVADANGQQIGTGNMFLGQNNILNFLQPQQEQAKTEGGITLSEMGNAAAQALGRYAAMGRGAGFGGDQQQGQLPNAELIKLLRDPVTNDPLSFHVTEAMKAVAGDSNFIALLPDSMAGTVAQYLRTPKSADQVLKTAKDTWNMEVEQANGWTTVAPARRYDSRVQRVDRVALKSLIDNITKKGAARLDDIAVYATRAPMTNQGGLDTAIIRLVDPASVQTLNQVYNDDREMLLMYASMGASTRANLANGQKQAVNSVSTTSFNLLASMVFNSQGGPTIGGQQRGNNAQSGQTLEANSAQVVGGFSVSLTPALQQQGRQQGRGGGPQQGFRGGGRGNMSTERTEVLAQGVPSNAVVSMQHNQSAVAKAVNSGAGLSRVYSAQMLAGERAIAEAPVQQGGGARPPRPTISWDGYVTGTRSTYTFLFELAPGITLTRRLEDTSFDANAKPTAFNQLPQDFQRAVDAGYQQIKDERIQREQRAQERNQQGRGGNGRRGNRPPAP